MKLLTIFITVLLWAATPAYSYTAFEKLQSDFHSSVTLEEEDFLQGESWKCSSSLHAADKNFRLVQIWYNRFQFGQIGDQIINFSYERDEFTDYALKQGEGDALDWISVSRSEPHRQLILRKDPAGNIIYQIQQLIDMPPRRRGGSLRQKWSPVSFGICEVPSHRNNDFWENEDRVWFLNKN